MAALPGHGRDLNEQDFSKKTMIEYFDAIISALTQTKQEKQAFSLFDPAQHFHQDRSDDVSIAQSLNAAFLMALAQSQADFGQQCSNGPTRKVLL